MSLSTAMCKALTIIGGFGVTDFGYCAEAQDYIDPQTVHALIRRGMLEKSKRKVLWKRGSYSAKCSLFRVNPFFWRQFFDFYWWIENQKIEVDRVTDQDFKAFAAIMGQYVDPDFVTRQVGLIRDYWHYVQHQKDCEK